jgi:hypothetical protein
MHKNPVISSNSSKTLQRPTRLRKKTRYPFGLVSIRKRKVSKGFHPSHVNEVKWFKGCPDIRVE